MITTGPAPGIAHGIGATSRPTSDIDLADMKHVVPARSTHRKPSPVASRPATGPVAPEPRPVTPAVAMEDDVPVVTEWTSGGLPQRRSRGRAPLGSHNLPAQSTDTGAGRSNGYGNGNGQPNGKEPPPGIWLEAFTKAANGVPREPGTDEDSDDAWDKGDLK